jgi:hypothetical protein
MFNGTMIGMKLSASFQNDGVLSSLSVRQLNPVTHCKLSGFGSANNRYGFHCPIVPVFCNLAEPVSE